jgi:hypothetical protein
MAKVIASIAPGNRHPRDRRPAHRSGRRSEAADPGDVQAWYKAQPKDRKALPPEASLLSLNLLYGLMFDYKTQDDTDKCLDTGNKGSKQVDKFRKTLTHSPDRKLNKQMDQALNRAGDAFDNCGFDGAKAVARSEVSGRRSRPHSSSTASIRPNRGRSVAPRLRRRLPSPMT